MQGAREYANLFRSVQQRGRLYVVPGCHARGKTFHVYVLPEGEAANAFGANPPVNKDAVEVYGAISGQCGWDEVYGWIHYGPWQSDFERWVEELRREKEEKEAELLEAGKKLQEAEKLRVAKLLAGYTPEGP